jgi:hypothetical protein
MFGKKSRYRSLETVQGKDRMGRAVQVVKLRSLPAVNGVSMTVADQSQLDILSESIYSDATRFWHIADANSELEAGELVRVTGRIIQVPEF